MLRSVVVLLVMACSAAPPHPLGWFRADRAPKNGVYLDRFSQVALLDPASSCADVTAEQHGPATRPVVVLIPGAGGDGPEMEEAVPELVQWQPPSLYMMRWSVS